ncbi:hypothetical protein E4U60_006736 [Claviceps pazoutovae]|uniref:methionyl-tRNA formyltransferase n=1 Tax=Claviceps pazoutovae TaxID=1649127 RepID=A0A9P7MGM7_9HYPO|nr:hypothetical protein E4U60_006736 [Claviceps pazoutovae]
MFRLFTPVKPRLFVALLSRRPTSTLSTPHAPARRPQEPLRILFCGSDKFSCPSLKALHQEMEQKTGLVESIEVVVLPNKFQGRGMKYVEDGPCKSLAQDLGLRLHERGTFEDWDLPVGTNLIVVVSYGVFIPARILASAKYGGLNVHPSLLPDLHGAAPLHHALLRGDTHTGVSLQTLDDKAFDRGTILAQTPPPGLPISPNDDLDRLRNDTAAHGAKMLIQGLRDGLHIPPYRDVGWKAAQLKEQGIEKPQHARRTTKKDSMIQPNWTAEDFSKRYRTFGKVWTYAIFHHNHRANRIILDDVEPVTLEDDFLENLSPHERLRVLIFECRAKGGGMPMRHERWAVWRTDCLGAALIHAKGNEWVRVRRIRIAGRPDRHASLALPPFAQRRREIIEGEYAMFYPWPVEEV